MNNDDDDPEGSQNVDKKINLRRFKSYGVYLDPINFSNVGRTFPGVEFLRTLSMFKKRKKTLSWYVHVPMKSRIRRIHVVVVQWTSKEYTKKRNTRAERLFCS